MRHKPAIPNKRRAREGLRQAQKKLGGAPYDYARDLEEKIKRSVIDRTAELNTLKVAA